MKIVGWNINGLRGKSMNLFNDKTKEYNTASNLNVLIQKYSPDVVCFGETNRQNVILIYLKNYHLNIALLFVQEQGKDIRVYVF